MESNINVEKTAKNRILEIDILRGIAVLFMILDHLIYDLWGLLPNLFIDFPYKLYNFAIMYWKWDFRLAFRYVIVFIFMGLVGICSTFSKSNVKRGSRLLGIAMLLTICTIIVSNATNNYSNLITFGTLHCIAFSILFVGLLEKFIKNKWYYLILGLIMLALGVYFEIVSTIEVFYSNITFKESVVIIFKQIIGSVECGGDTMGFLLNGGQVLVGYFIGKLLYEKRESIFGFKYSNNVLTYIGRNSLVVYFLHQILIPIVIGLILISMGYHYAF